MPTIDEIFAALPDEVAQDVNEYLVIDPASRTIKVPEAESIFGVEEDEDSERKYFICPRYVGDNLDLAACFLSIKYRNANGEKDEYLVEDTAVNGEYVTFSWLISEKVVKYKGVVQFRFYADPGTGKAWGTTLAQGESLEGLEPEIDASTVEEETSDVVTQLRAMVAQQTTNVEAVGAAQVAAVKAAGATATADAQEQIEAKGAATLATIPDDYTTMAGKVNEHANAIKGHLVGQIVRADDVSPVEHYLGVKVQGKNLWNMSVITSADGKFTNNGDGTITVNGGEYYCRAAQTLAEICPQLRTGDIVKFTISTTAYAGIFLNVANTLVQNGYALTITEAMLASYVALYGVLDTDESFNDPHTIQYIQLELGTVATEYTPYIDPTTVTLTRCGKNILPWPYYDGESNTTGGITYTVQEDGGIKAKGTATANSYYRLMRRKLAGLPYVLTDCTHDNANLFTYITVFKGETVDKVFYPHVELGTAATEYAKPVEQQEAIPAEDGTVGGLTSVAPAMTIFPDAANVTMECEYNRDSNAVYAELLAKIAALSGTT